MEKNQNVFWWNKWDLKAKFEFKSGFMPFQDTDPNFRLGKGQLILKCPFGIFKSSKKPTKFFIGFLPKPLKRCQIKKNKGTLYH